MGLIDGYFVITFATFLTASKWPKKNHKFFTRSSDRLQVVIRVYLAHHDKDPEQSSANLPSHPVLNAIPTC